MTGPVPSDSENKWGLGCNEKSQGDTGGVHHDLRVRRYLVDDEERPVLQANDLLYALTNSAYNRLAHKLDEFFEGIELLRRFMETQEPAPEPGLRERFGDVLYAFRVYLDHTPNELKKLFGSGSAAEREFRTACSSEYDGWFEYRLSYNLRNEAQHKRDVVTVTYGSTVVGVGLVDRRVEISVSDAVLNEALQNDKWQARVRRELEDHPRPIRADDLLRALQASVTRILAKTLLAQRDQIADAITLVRSLANEAKCKDEAVLIRRKPRLDNSSAAQLRLDLRPLEIRAAEIIEKALGELQRSLWPGFAIPIWAESMNESAFAELVRAISDTHAAESPFVKLMEGVGVFVGLRAASAAVAKELVVSASRATFGNDPTLSVGDPIPVQDQ